MPQQLDTFEEFENQVLKASPEKLVVVDFWATTCGPCVQFAPTFDKMAEEMTDMLFFKVRNQPNQEILVPDWLIISHVIQITSSDWLCTVFQVDVDKNEETSRHAGIISMPTFKIYRGGKVLGTVKGANEAKLRDNILRWIRLE